MQIKAIVIDGQKGEITITRTTKGATVTRYGQVIAEFGRDESPEAIYAKSLLVAGYVFGTFRGKPTATNSMVHEVMNEIERMAGC